MKKQSEKIISAVVLAKNEEIRLAKCLTSLRFADEIIVINNNSTDRTAEIARNSGAHVIKSSAVDFSVLRTLGITSSRGEWVLYVDADEIVTTPLELEILSLIKHWSRATDPVCYYISRKNYFLGVLWPSLDKMQRLLYKPAFVRWSGSLHETALVSGASGELKNALIHDTHRSLEEMTDKTNTWSDEEARLRLVSGHPDIQSWRFLRVFISGFFRSYLRESGWKAGVHGWIESIYQGFSMVITYIKLWELQKHS